MTMCTESRIECVETFMDWSQWVALLIVGTIFAILAASKDPVANMDLTGAIYVLWNAVDILYDKALVSWTDPGERKSKRGCYLAGEFIMFVVGLVFAIIMWNLGAEPHEPIPVLVSAIFDLFQGLLIYYQRDFCCLQHSDLGESTRKMVITEGIIEFVIGFYWAISAATSLESVRSDLAAREIITKDQYLWNYHLQDIAEQEEVGSIKLSKIAFEENQQLIRQMKAVVMLVLGLDKILDEVKWDECCQKNRLFRCMFKMFYMFSQLVVFVFSIAYITEVNSVVTAGGGRDWMSANLMCKPMYELASAGDINAGLKSDLEKYAFVKQAKVSDWFKECNKGPPGGEKFFTDWTKYQPVQEQCADAVADSGEWKNILAKAALWQKQESTSANKIIDDTEITRDQLVAWLDGDRRTLLSLLQDNVEQFNKYVDLLQRYSVANSKEGGQSTDRRMVDCVNEGRTIDIGDEALGAAMTVITLVITGLASAVQGWLYLIKWAKTGSVFGDGNQVEVLGHKEQAQPQSSPKPYQIDNSIETTSLFKVAPQPQGSRPNPGGSSGGGGGGKEERYCGPISCCLCLFFPYCCPCIWCYKCDKR